MRFDKFFLYCSRTCGFRLFRSKSGSILPAFALTLPALIALCGGAMDYASVIKQKNRLTGVADATALAVGRQMTLTSLNDVSATKLARGFVLASYSGFESMIGGVDASIASDNKAVTVVVKEHIKLPVGLLGVVDPKIQQLSASATARVGQQTKLCLLSLADVAADSKWVGANNFQSSEKTGINLMRDSRITARDCVLHTNIKSKDAFRIESGARIVADLICAAGGVTNAGGTVTANIVQDCPTITNPMGKRTGISNAPCLPGTEDGTYISQSKRTLPAGSYCGDIVISGTAQVKMEPGTFRIRGALIVKDNAQLVGERVGIYLWSGGNTGKAGGNFAYFRFLDNALIDLSAPENGQLAGLLIWESINSAALEDRTGTAGANYHVINTSRAKRPNGTIYLPAGRLYINSPVRVAEESDYTVLVVNRLDLADGPNLVLNANYAKSRVPVPDGLGPIGAKTVVLER